MNKKEIGKKLRIERKKANYTMKQLSILSGIEQNTIQAYETGKSNIPTDKIILLSKIFNKDPNFFLLDKVNSKHYNDISNDINIIQNIFTTTVNQFNILAEEDIAELNKLIENYIIKNQIKK